MVRKILEDAGGDPLPLGEEGDKEVARAPLGWQDCYSSFYFIL